MKKLKGYFCAWPWGLFFYKQIKKNCNPSHVSLCFWRPKPHQSTHFLYTIENSPMDFSREAKHHRTISNSNVSRGEKLHEVWVIVLCGRFTVENAWFSKYCNLFHMLLIHFSCYFGKRRRFLPPGAYAFLTSSVHVPLDTVFNQIW